MLFINADREYHEGRAQNELLPQHIEKIVSAYQAFGDVANFAKVVTHSEVKDNDYNLNIRRYADNTPVSSRRTFARICMEEFRYARSMRNTRYSQPTA